jgi:hypothetical protein
VLIHNGFELGSDLADGRVPGDPLKLIPHPFQRIQQAVGMMLVMANAQAFAADVPLAVQIILVAPNLGNPVIFSANFQSA